MKEFADDNFKLDENGRKFSKQVENTVGKGEIARYEQFLLPQCYQKVTLCGNGVNLTLIQAHFSFFFPCFQGVLLLKPEVVPDGQEGNQKIMRLWIHEVYRVFYDRLVDENDRDLFFHMVKVSATCLIF